MTTNKPDKTPDQHPESRSDDSAERLAALLRDLETLQAYLQDRGRHSYELAQKFMANAQRDAGSRAYDERQATMLEYQHYIWHEIAGRVSQLLLAYGPEYAEHDAADTSSTPDSPQTSPSEQDS